MLLTAAACGDDSESIGIESPPIDLVDPCAFATTDIISQAVGVPMLRSATGGEDADTYRVCRWVENPAELDEPTIDYLADPARNYVDIVLRQTTSTTSVTVEQLFDEASSATNSREVPSLLATDADPFLGDGAVRTDTTLWVLKEDRMAMILTNTPGTLDLLIDSIGFQLIDRL